MPGCPLTPFLSQLVGSVNCWLSHDRRRTLKTTCKDRDVCDIFVIIECSANRKTCALALVARAGYNAPVNDSLPAPEAACRLLAATWDPASRPAADAIPWAEVLSLVEGSNAAPAVYAAARDMAMPAVVQDALEQAFFRSAAANTRCLHQLAAVADALSRTGAPLLLLKGAALAETLYGDPGLRTIGDIDLLVPREHARACRDALLGFGYRPTQLEEQPGSLLATSNQEAFEPPPPHRTVVELHWHILDVPYYMHQVPVSWFWENSEAAEIAGRPFRVLSPEANLVYLPAHLAFHHRFQPLHSLFDLALLIARRGVEIDWARVVTTAHSFELLTVLRETLDRLAECWPSLPLDEARRQVAAVAPSRMDARLYRHLTEEARSTPLRFYTTLVTLPDLASRLRYARLVVFPQPSYMRGRYRVGADWQLPYWYLRRLVGGVARFARALPRARRIEKEDGRRKKEE